MGSMTRFVDIIHRHHRKIRLLALALLLLIGYLAGLGIAWWEYSAPSQTEVSQFGVFWEAWHTLQQKYYGELPALQPMTYAAIRGVLALLNDPYTTFVEPQPRQLERDDLRGSFGGIGAWIKRTPQGEYVLTPMPDGPAARAGLQDGDVLIRVDDTPITPEMTIQDVQLLIRGPIGTPVRLTIRREGHPTPLTLVIVRQEIQTPSVTWRVLEEAPDIGYVHISLFTERTPEELRSALEDLEGKGANKLLLDLRDNGGGLLESAIQVSSEFLTDGVVLYEVKRGEETPYPVRAGGTAQDQPLVVLVNGGTASASEIVAGAIQAHGRGPLVGEKTFGKGSVQLIYDLSDGSSLHVTAAYWLTPARHRIDGQGLTPDIIVPLTEEDRAQGRDPQMEQGIAYLRK